MSSGYQRELEERESKKVRRNCDIDFLRELQIEVPGFDLATLYFSLMRSRLRQGAINTDARRLYELLKRQGVLWEVHIEKHDDSYLYLSLSNNHNALNLLTLGGIPAQGYQRSRDALVPVGDPDGFLREFRMHYDIDFLPLLAANVNYGNVRVRSFNLQFMDMTIYR